MWGLRDRKKTWHLLNLYLPLKHLKSLYHLFTLFPSLLITSYLDGDITSTVMSEMRWEPWLAAGCHPWGHLTEALTTSEHDGWGSLCVFVYVCECQGGSPQCRGSPRISVTVQWTISERRGQDPIDQCCYTRTQKEREREGETERKGPDMMTTSPRREREREEDSSLEQCLSFRLNIVIPFENKSHTNTHVAENTTITYNGLCY